MLNLTNPGTADLIEIVTSAAGDIDTIVSYADLNTSTNVVTPSRQVTTVQTAATTTICAGPASGSVRNVKEIQIRNTHATIANTILVRYNVGGTVYELHNVTLNPGDKMEYVEGIGWFTITSVTTPTVNRATADQSLSTSDVYLAGSAIAMPAGLPLVGTTYHCVINMAKTAGTGSPVVTLRLGTGGGVVGDNTNTLAFTFGIGTSVADNASFDVYAQFRTVGAGSAAVIQGRVFMVPNLAVTGFGGTTPIRSVTTTGAGFDSTTANLTIGVSFNGSTAFAGTAKIVAAELVQN